MSRKMGDEEFMKWALSFKPCRYCGEKFVGPVCPCEQLTQGTKRK